MLISVCICGIHWLFQLASLSVVSDGWWTWRLGHEHCMIAGDDDDVIVQVPCSECGRCRSCGRWSCHLSPVVMPAAAAASSLSWFVYLIAHYVMLSYVSVLALMRHCCIRRLILPAPPASLEVEWQAASIIICVNSSAHGPAMPLIRAHVVLHHNPEWLIYHCVVLSKGCRRISFISAVDTAESDEWMLLTVCGLCSLLEPVRVCRHSSTACLLCCIVSTPTRSLLSAADDIWCTVLSSRFVTLFSINMQLFPTTDIINTAWKPGDIYSSSSLCECCPLVAAGELAPVVMAEITWCWNIPVIVCCDHDNVWHENCLSDWGLRSDHPCYDITTPTHARLHCCSLPRPHHAACLGMLVCSAADITVKWYYYYY